MQPYLRNEQRTVTAEKVRKILLKHGTVISLDDAGLLLDFLYKISNLSVGEAIRRAMAQGKKASAEIKKVCTKKQK